MAIALERSREPAPLRAVPRVLCYVNHYYGPSPGFGGKSTRQTRAVLERLKRAPLLYAAWRALKR